MLKSIDSKFSKLVARGDDKIDALARAAENGDGRRIYAELSAAYGALDEVMFLKGDKAVAVLVFEGGVGVKVGAGSYIPILTFGYHGQGPSAFSAFLAAAGFSNADATTITPPVRLNRNGTLMRGESKHGQVIWQDGSVTSDYIDQSL